MTDALLLRLDAWLRARRPGYYAALRPGASDVALDAFAAALGAELPPAFRALYRWRDGQDPQSSDSLVDNLMFTPLAEVAGTKAMLDDMIGYDFADGWWRRSWLPFLSNGGGDHVCPDLGPDAAGRLVTFWHDDGHRATAHDSVDAWLAALVRSMDDGSYDPV